MNRRQGWLDANTIGHLVFLLLAAVWMVASLRFRYGTLLDPGPAFLPFNLGVFMAGMSAWGLIRALLRGGVGAAVAKSAEEDERPKVLSDRQLIRKVIVSTVATVVFVFLLEPLGFAVAMTALLAVYFLIGGMRMARAPLWALGGTIGSWTLFELILGLPLPGRLLDSVFGL